MYGENCEKNQLYGDHNLGLMMILILTLVCYVVLEVFCVFVCTDRHTQTDIQKYRVLCSCDDYRRYKGTCKNIEIK